MPKSLYLVNPAADFPAYFSAEAFAGRGYRPAALIADLATATVAALAGDGFWNRALPGAKMAFVTQISIDAAKDEELLRLLGEAGVNRLFIGIETPNPEALRQARKRQNLGISLVDQIQRFYDHGLMVIGGMIVGFDADGPDIFERQFEFATEAAMPVISLGALVAPAATPLYDRMEREGRLVESGAEVAALPWSTNIVPKRLTQEQLLSGIRWLANNLYSPAAFGDRVESFIERLGRRRDPRNQDRRQWHELSVGRPVDQDSVKLVRGVALMGLAEAKMVARIVKAVIKKPSAFEFAASMILHYAQIRYMYEHGRFWEAQLAAEPSPAFETALPIAV